MAFAAVVGRLAFVQGVSAARYSALGESQRIRTVTLPATRGTIFDRNGAELAMSVDQKTVWANPQLVRDPAAEAHALASFVGVDEAVLRSRLSASAAFVYIARKIDDATADQIAALHLPGVSFIEEPKRFDPAGPLAGPLLGQVGTDNDGLSGLEVQYEHQLSGRPGELIVERDPRGTDIVAGMHEFRPAVRGEDLALTIDRSLQYEAEQALAAQITATTAKGGIAIVMDPRSGDILAMASLTTGQAGQPPGPAQANLAMTNVYEPGSVNKVITIAAALEAGLIQPSDTIVVPDHLTVANASFADDEPHPTKPFTITDIVAKSSNIGAILVGQRVGKARLDRELRAFGLGHYTGIGFPGESPGLLLDPKDWSVTSLATVPIGQGLAVTALQMLDVYNTVANGGVFVPPRLVRSVVDGRGRAHDVAAAAPRRVISETTARELLPMLEEVVRSGTAKAAQIDGYTVAGKTGTARKPLEGGHGYKDGAYMATFAGFVPAERPRLSAIVVLDEPTPVYGGLVSAPVFADVARYALRLLAIPPPAGPAPALVAAAPVASVAPAAPAAPAAAAGSASAGPASTARSSPGPSRSGGGPSPPAPATTIGRTSKP